MDIDHSVFIIGYFYDISNPQYPDILFQYIRTAVRISYKKSPSTAFWVPIFHFGGIFFKILLAY